MATGQLGKEDYILEQEKPDGGLKIVPFNQEIDLKLASYDITPTIIAMSSKVGMLETVYQEKDDAHRFYIMVKAKDTVMIVSHEFISVPANIAGYVVSRVSKVSDGFGHVSTSIDPNWSGALLIGLSNPTNKAIKVYVGGEREASTKGDALATLSFHYLNSPDDQAKLPDPDFKGMRLDILDKKKYSARTGVKAWVTRRMHPFRRRFTDSFFAYIGHQRVDLSTWKEIAKALSGLPADGKANRFDSYIVKDTRVQRVIRRLRKWWPLVSFVTAAIFFSLWQTSVIPDGIKSTIVNALGEVKKLRDLLPFT